VLSRLILRIPFFKFKNLIKIIEIICISFALFSMGPKIKQKKKDLRGEQSIEKLGWICFICIHFYLPYMGSNVQELFKLSKCLLSFQFSIPSVFPHNCKKGLDNTPKEIKPGNHF